MSKIIVYLRTSTTDQNPENQKKDCLSICKSEWGEPEIHPEEKSAWKKEENRPVFESIKKQIKQGRVKHLVVWDLDRIYRNRKRLKEFFEFSKYYKCQIHSYRQQFLEKFNEIPEPFNEIMYDVMLSFLGWIAEEESQKKSERVKIAYQNRKGNWGRKSYVNNRVKNDIIRLKQQGYSVRQIASQVTYYDKNKNIKNVSKSVVSSVLKQEGY